MKRRFTINRLRSLWDEALPETAEHTKDALLYWLVTQYTDPRRAYHNIAHIERMFSVWRETASGITAVHPQALSLAIWFHDAVYDPTRNDNEARSAEEAVARLRPFNLSEETLTLLRTMILATASHQASATDNDTALLLDLDLAILGAEASEYDVYARAIRDEYSFVPDRAYCTGRATVLRRFLDRARIYATSPLYQCCEERARQNLAREIEALEAAREL